MPVAVAVADPRGRTTTLRYHGGFAPDGPDPQRLDLDLGIERERGLRLTGQPEVHGVTEIVAGKLELQADRFFAHRPLNPMLALPYRLTDHGRTSPHRRTQPALAGQRGHRPVAGRVGQHA